jgi:hypothetical protein
MPTNRISPLQPAGEWSSTKDKLAEHDESITELYHSTQELYSRYDEHGDGIEGLEGSQ